MTKAAGCTLPTTEHTIRGLVVGSLEIRSASWRLAIDRRHRTQWASVAEMGTCTRMQAGIQSTTSIRQDSAPGKVDKPRVPQVDKPDKGRNRQNPDQKPPPEPDPWRPVPDRQDFPPPPKPQEEDSKPVCGVQSGWDVVVPAIIFTIIFRLACPTCGLTTAGGGFGPVLDPSGGPYGGERSYFQ